MIRAFYNGISGVKTQAFGLDVIANNISNINNVGFLGSTPEFKTVFYENLSTASAASSINSQIGLGSTAAGSALNLKQGSLQITDSTFDLAINGRGFFGVSGSDGQRYFTRKGDFSLDRDGNLVTKSGEFVLGTLAQLTETALSTNAREKLGNTLVNGQFTPISQAYTITPNTKISLAAQDAQTPIKLPSVMFLPSQPTTNVKLSAALEASIKTKNAPITIDSQTITKTISEDGTKLSISANLKDTKNVISFNPDDEVEIKISDQNAANITKKAKIDPSGKFELNDIDITGLDTDNIDILATSRAVQEVAQNRSFSMDIIAPNGDKNILKLNFTKNIPTQIDNPSWHVQAQILSPNNEVISTADGEVSFNSKGALASNTLTTIDNGGSGLNINLGSIYNQDNPNTGFDGIVTNFDAKKDSKVEKDGIAEGLLKEYQMNDEAEVVAYFDNGLTSPVAKIALYHFQNPQGLSKVGSNNFVATPNSGEPIFYTNANGEVIYGAKIKAGALEMSNVDLASELTQMIVLQKAYDASAKSITTGDALIKRAIDMKK